MTMTIHCDIVSAEEEIFAGLVEMLVATAELGEMGVTYGHAALLSSLIPGVETDGAFIRVSRNMETSLPGVYAAGDCTGLPLQVAKAVGEGCIAALAAAQELR